MAAKKTEREALDLDDLLELTPDDVPSPPAVDEPEVPVDSDFLNEEEEPEETPEQARIRELEAQLAKLSAGPPELTPEQKRIKELEEQLAAATAAPAADPDVQFAPAASGSQETILLHFVKDGLVLCGQTWYRGQELEFVIGSEAHKQQLDRNGKSWLDLVDDIDAQYERWGDQYFAPGPWRGRKWESAPVPPDIIDAVEISKYKIEIEEAAKKERRRGRAAPLMRMT